MERKSKFFALVIIGIILITNNSCKKSEETHSNNVKDIEGNIYKTVTIGAQVWMTSNIKTTKYNDGTAIPLVTDNTAWSNLKTPAYCWYNNDATTNKSTYGALYNWYSVSSTKLCPTGWHVPSYADWTTLITYLGGVNVTGGKLKEAGTSHWLSPNTGATNETFFTYLPGGVRYSFGDFTQIGDNGYLWSSDDSTQGPSYTATNSWNSVLYRGNVNKKTGFSVRCLKD
jgi:uncharacterized protein (TIGR02145 family)